MSQKHKETHFQERDKYFFLKHILNYLSGLSGNIYGFPNNFKRSPPLVSEMGCKAPGIEFGVVSTDDHCLLGQKLILTPLHHT